jgi:hypothetical protein
VSKATDADGQPLYFPSLSRAPPPLPRRIRTSPQTPAAPRTGFFISLFVLIVRRFSPRWRARCAGDTWLPPARTAR